MLYAASGQRHSLPVTKTIPKVWNSRWWAKICSFWAEMFTACNKNHIPCVKLPVMAENIQLLGRETFTSVKTIPPRVWRILKTGLKLNNTKKESFTLVRKKPAKESQDSKMLLCQNSKNQYKTSNQYSTSHQGIWEIQFSGSTHQFEKTIEISRTFT